MLATLSQGQEILKLVSQSRIEKDDFQALLESGRVTDLLKEYIGKTQKINEDVYTSTVDYSMSLSEMIHVANIDYVNANITIDNFLVKGKGQVKVESELIHLNGSASSQDVLDEMERRGLRAAKIEELLAFGAKYPQLHPQFPIMCLGSVWRCGASDRRVPYLSRDGDQRRLCLHTDVGWADYCRFLAVRKETLVKK